MNVVDSSAWLAYFADEPNAGRFQAPLSEPASLIVPTVTLYEVFKVVLRESDESHALQAVAAMQQGNVVPLTPELAVAASRLSLAHRLPMADSAILATAQAYGATLWTQDRDFEPIPGVRYFPKENESFPR